jgi:hypothetical protein
LLRANTESIRGSSDDRSDALCATWPRQCVRVTTVDDDRAHAFRDAYAAFLHGRGIEPKIALDGVRVRAAYGADAKLVESFVR